MDVNNMATVKIPGRWTVLGVGVACLAYVASALAMGGRLPYFDDELGYYVPQALRILDGPNSWQVALGGYIGHPPLMELSLVALWQLTGHTLGGTRVLLAFFGAATLALTGASALRWRGHRPAVGASVLLASSPLFYFHSQSAIPEVLVTLGVAAALWAVVSGRVVTLVAALSAAALAKPTVLVIVPAIVLYMIMQSRRRQRPVDRWSVLAVVAIPMALTLGWMAAWAVTPDLAP